jgi:hypothetical protein
MFSNVVLEMGNRVELDMPLVRHMVLNCIKSYRRKYTQEFGQLVIACDNVEYWRKGVFPFYKAKRKKEREASKLNWPLIFKCMNQMRAELKEHFPYPLIDVKGAEADDVIAVLVQNAKMNERILILAADKDYIQLHSRFGGVTQYDPVRKRYVSDNDPDNYLLEHVIRGDAGDGIPNIFSPDDCFVTGIRQKPVTAKLISEWQHMGTDLEQHIQTMPDHIGRNWHRNKMLIDLTCIPQEVRERILNEFAAQQGKDRKKLFNYFIESKLKNLMTDIQAF